MRRRELIAFIGCAALLPTAGRAQQPVPVIGFLGSASRAQWSARINAFHDGLAETGFAEGRNVALEYRWAEGRNDRLPGLAADLVGRRVAVIVVLGNTSSVLAAKAATTTTPVVFRVAVDPVDAGLVASLGRPGGMLTGVTTLGVELAPKQLQLLHELVPSARDMALLINPTNPVIAEVQSRELPVAARTLGLELHILKASADRDFEGVFASLVRLRTGGLVIGADAFFNSRNEQLAALATRHAIPAISPYREFAEAGGILSYGGNIVDACRQAGVYVGRILKGERPADLPVQQAAKIEFVINQRSARALGLAIPPTLLARADEVIE